MSVRFKFRSPFGGTVDRGVVDGKWVEPPAGSGHEVIGASLWGLPGLADAHAHLAAEKLDFQPGVYEDAVERSHAALRAGVTLVLDKGWCDATTIRVIEDIAPHERPEIEAAARLIAVADGYYPDFAREIDPEDIEAAVSAELEAGAGWVKLVGDWPRKGIGPVANFDSAQLRRAVELADAAGSRVAIHTMAPEVPSMAVAAGVHSIEHGLFLTEDDIASLGARSGMWVPTLLRCETVLAQLGAGSSGGKLFTQGLANVARLLPVAIEAGVRVLAGTDLEGSPANVAAEMLKLAEYGLDATSALRSVSVAVFDGVGRSSGFELGTDADLVLFPSNPLEDLGVLSHPTLVMRLGEIS